MAGEPDNISEKFPEIFNCIYRLGSVNHIPGNMRFFGINVHQRDTISIEIKTDNKTDSLHEYSLASVSSLKDLSI